MSAIPFLLWKLLVFFFFQDPDPYQYPRTVDNPDYPDSANSGMGDFLWPDFNPTIVWVAFIIGLLIYLFGYIAGGRLSPGKIILCIIISSIIGFFSKSIMNPIFTLLVSTFGISPRSAFIITSTIWMIYVVGVGIMLYEMLTVTAEEAHPD